MTASRRRARRGSEVEALLDATKTEMQPEAEETQEDEEETEDDYEFPIWCGAAVGIL